MKLVSSLPRSPEHSTCLYTEIDQSSPNPVPNPIARRSILILSSYLRVVVSSGLFPSGCSTKPPYESPPPLSHMCYMPRPTHSCFDHPNNIWWGIQSLSSSLCSFLHSHVTSSLLGPDIFLSALFSDTFALCFLLSTRYRVSHPYKTGKIIGVRRKEENIKN